MDRLGLLIHLSSMQADVLRRVTERKHEELKALIDDKNQHLSQANKHILSKPQALPSLPNEIISQIFRQLQFIESACDESTLQRFLDDEGTADAWRQLVEIETPLVITGTGSVELAPNINANFYCHGRWRPSDHV